MKRLCLGGSFNPIHLAHVECARAAAVARGFDRVVLIPSAQPPHKPAAELAPPDDRLAMCRLVSRIDPLFETSDIELNRAGPSYTLHTVRRLKEQGWSSVSWLIGADMLLYLPNWHEPQALVSEAELLIVARPGWSIDWTALPGWMQPLRQNVVHAPLLPISATDIRRRVRAGEPIDHLTLPIVARHIAQRRLYQ